MTLSVIGTKEYCGHKTVRISITHKDSRKVYDYIPQGYTPEEFVKIVYGIKRHSHGKAIQWIKKHSRLAV